MAKAAAFLWVLLMVIGSVLFPSDACPQTGDCSDAVGQWEFKVFGRDCKGYEEEGKFVMTIGADCTMSIDILSNIPYAAEYLVRNKSLTVSNRRFVATVDFTLDACSTLLLKGRIIDGKRIEGTYRYNDGGGGTFNAVKKAAHPANSGVTKGTVTKM